MSQDAYTRMFTAAFHNIPFWRQLKCLSTVEWMMNCGLFIYLNATELRTYMNYNKMGRSHKYNCCTKEEFTKETQNMIPFIQSQKQGTSSYCLGMHTLMIKIQRSIDKIISTIKIVITHGGVKRGRSPGIVFWGAGNDMFLNLGDSCIGVALKLLPNCMFYAFFMFFSVVSELKGYPSYFLNSCELSLTLSCTLMVALNICFF